MDERLERYLRDRFRRVGRQYERTRNAYAEGKGDSSPADEAASSTESTDKAIDDLPTDGSGRYKLVCRRYAEKRAVAADDEGRPACFEADHPDCAGCVEDIHDRRIETW